MTNKEFLYAIINKYELHEQKLKENKAIDEQTRVKLLKSYKAKLISEARAYKGVIT